MRVAKGVTDRGTGPVPQHWRRVRALQALVALVLGALTLAIATEPGVGFSIASSELDLVVHTLVALVALAVANLGYVRSRESGDSAALFDGAAFLLAGILNATQVTLVVTGLSTAAGLDPANPRPLPMYAAAVARVVIASLLLLGAVPALRARRARSTARIVFVAPTAVFLAAVLGLAALDGRVDRWLDPGGLATLATAGDGNPFAAGPVTLLNVLGTALLFVVAYLRPAYLGGALPSPWLAIALTIGAFGWLHAVLFPASFAGVVTTEAGLQLGFYATLFVALQATRRDDLRAARRVEQRRRRFHHADVAAAVEAERLRLARELHDTVVQGVLAARREHTMAAEMLPPDATHARQAAARVGAMLAAAVTEARSLIDVLREGHVGERRLIDELAPRLRNFAERHGYTLEYREDPALAVVTGSRSIEVLRIVDEALSNVRRHADATTVRVAAVRAGDQLILTIADNGRGFDPEHTTPGHGITGIRERTEILGGRLTIHSAHGEGTQLRLFVPLQADDED
jgi:signal transduction histidine kinase